MPKLTMHKIKLLYRLGRIRTKPKKVYVAKAGVMDEGELERCMAIVKECKNK